MNRRLSSVNPDVSASGHLNSEDSPPVGPARLPAGPSFASKPASPASYSLSALSSPRAAEQYSPASISPRVSVFDTTTIHHGRDSRNVPDATYQYAGPTTRTYGSGLIPGQQHASPFQSAIALPSRRSVREQNRLPALTHEDTTLSSESGHSGSSYRASSLGSVGTMIPLDSGKSYRTLPQPVPNIGPSTSPLDRPPHAALLPQLPASQPDYRTQGALAALVRAGEIAARIANDEEMDEENAT